jgi:aldehyde dehydrogenase (NAD+)
MTPTEFIALQQFYQVGNTRSYAFRKAQLKALLAAIKEHETEITNALYADLKKSPEEAYTTEIGFIYQEINYTLQHLQSWMQPQKVSTPLALQPSSSYIHRDPLGISLIIAPWNYPFQILMAPLIGAIAGGNCAILKPSEFTPATTSIVTSIIKKTFSPNYIAIVEGDGSTQVPYIINNFAINHIFFTGSIAVGKLIAQLAAPKLIPTTLELGGKSPCIVDDTANLQVAAKRIIWGKFTNAGQTCVAPDYVLVHKKVKDAFLQLCTEAIEKFYTSNPLQSYDYGKIINAKRWHTLTSYLKEATVVFGGITNEEKLYISPTIVENVVMNSTLMQEEIFGPILPLIEYSTNEQAREIIEQDANPLSLYIFSGNTSTQKYFTKNIAFGGGCINNTLVHLGNPSLPFGGVGNSGVGQYHGVYSFEAFTRPKSIVKTNTLFDPSLKYPPYKGMLKWLKLLLK